MNVYILKVFACKQSADLIRLIITDFQHEHGFLPEMFRSVLSDTPIKIEPVFPAVERRKRLVLRNLALKRQHLVNQRKKKGLIKMNLVCLDLEGVLVPEIWIAFSKASGIPELSSLDRKSVV